MHKYRLLRVIEYTGSREFIDECINHRSIKGTKLINGPIFKDCAIREAIIGETTEFLEIQEKFEDRKRNAKNK